MSASPDSAGGANYRLASAGGEVCEPHRAINRSSTSDCQLPGISSGRQTAGRGAKGMLGSPSWLVISSSNAAQKGGLRSLAPAIIQVPTFSILSLGCCCKENIWENIWNSRNWFILCLFSSCSCITMLARMASAHQ